MWYCNHAGVFSTGHISVGVQLAVYPLSVPVVSSPQHAASQWCPSASYLSSLPSHPWHHQVSSCIFSFSNFSLSHVLSAGSTFGKNSTFMEIIHQNNWRFIFSQVKNCMCQLNKSQASDLRRKSFTIEKSKTLKNKDFPAISYKSGAKDRTFKTLNCVLL